MAGGFDKISNGLLFGALFGILLQYSSVSTSSFLSFWSSWMSSLSTWLLAQSWMAWASSISGYMTYILSGILGAAVGAYIDSR